MIQVQSRWPRACVLAVGVVFCSATGVFAQVVTAYAYDAQGQVTGVNRGGAIATYSYDQAGNRAAVTTSTGAAPSAMAARAGTSSSQAPTGLAEATARLRQPPPADRVVPPPPPLGPPSSLPPAMISGVIVARPPVGSQVKP